MRAKFALRLAHRTVIGSPKVKSRRTLRDGGAGRVRAPGGGDEVRQSRSVRRTTTTGLSAADWAWLDGIPPPCGGRGRAIPAVAHVAERTLPCVDYRQQSGLLHCCNIVWGRRQECRPRCRHCESASVTRRNRCTAANGEVSAPIHEGRSTANMSPFSDETSRRPVL